MGTRPNQNPDPPSLGVLLGRRVARERDRSGLSRSDFSRRVDALANGVRGTSRTALRNLEEGRVDAPRKEVVQAIATVLGVREDWLWTGEPPRSRRRAPAFETPRPRPGPAEVGVPDVPDGHPVWGPGVARTIASRSALAQGPRTVRVRFWSVLRNAADRPASGVKGPDDALRLARELDDLVFRPLDLLRPGERPEGRWFEDYAVSVLDSLGSVLQERRHTVRSALTGSSAAPPNRRSSAGPPDTRGDPTPSLGDAGVRAGRVERDGLTWRLM